MGEGYLVFVFIIFFVRFITAGIFVMLLILFSFGVIGICWVYVVCLFMCMYVNGCMYAGGCVGVCI